MASEALHFIWETSLILSLSITYLYLTEPFTKRAFGPTAAYKFWAIIPLALLITVLTPALATLGTMAMLDTIGDIQSGASLLVEASQSVIPGHPAQTALQVARGETLARMLGLIWLVGCALSLGIFVLRQWSLRRSLGELSRTPAGYFVSQTSVIGPALIGVFKPKIVVPTNFDTRYDTSEKAMILAHERTHHRSADAQVNAAAVLFQCVYWFNPLVHFAAHRLRLIQELSCDAKVLKRFPKKKKQYAQLLLGTQLSQSSVPIGAFWPATSAPALKQRLEMLRASIDDRHSGRAIYIAVFGLGLMLAPGLKYGSSAFSNLAGLPSIATLQEQALLVAVQEGDIEQAIELLQHGVDPDISIPPLGTPLIVAARGGNLEMAKALVEGGSGVNIASRGQSFPLFAAIESEHAEIATYLLSQGARANVRVPEQDASPLSVASQKGSLPMVELLLGHGADPNMTIDDEGTPLIAAAMSGRISVVEALVHAGADIKLSATVERRTPNTQNTAHENTTALAEARRFERIDVADFLERAKDRQGLPAP